MFNKITIKSHFCKCCKSFEKGSAGIPAALFEVRNEKPALEDFPYPLPAKKSDFTCFAKTGNIEWFGGRKGLVRYDADAEYEYNKVIYFSAERDLRDNDVKALLPDGEKLWVLTDTAVTLIEPKYITGEEQADLLLDETLKFLDRRGMVSQKHLEKPFDFSSAFPYDNSDNDGGFTAGFAIGEILRYATFRREKGIDHPDTRKAKATATRSLESCLFLMYIHGRGNGFVARTCCCPDEPIPDDGFFFIRKGDKAVMADTTASRRRGVAGVEVDCSAPLPERLMKYIRNEGYDTDGIIYKADTSSDEITLHVLLLLFAHRYLTCDDKELDELVKSSLAQMVEFIIDGGFVLRDFSGEATTWAKWNEDYFKTEDGWVDGALNSAELLFYIKAAEEVCDNKKKFTDTYNYLVNERGYADMTMKHVDRLTQFCIATDSSFAGNIMFGDHMLAAVSFLGLCILEKDEELLKKYRYGYKSWRSSMGNEYNAGYDFMYLLGCPDETTDESRTLEWFNRCNISRLAASVTTVGRHDIAKKTEPDGYEDMSVLLPQDERYISKFDRNPFEYKDEDSGGKYVIESCYLYTLPYWMGRFFGFIDGQEK